MKSNSKKKIYNIYAIRHGGVKQIYSKKRFPQNFLTESLIIKFISSGVTLFGIDLREYRLKNSPAIGHAVAGVYVQMERMETEGAMVSRRVTERQNLFSAVDAGEPAIIFCKKLIHLNT